MTKDEVIALAAQAHIFLHHEDEMDVVGRTEILRFAELIAANDREECARIVESVNSYDNPMTAGDCSDAIRARGNHD